MWLNLSGFFGSDRDSAFSGYVHLLGIKRDRAVNPLIGVI
jgi:hypothetical protein